MNMTEFKLQKDLKSTKIHIDGYRCWIFIYVYIYMYSLIYIIYISYTLYTELTEFHNRNWIFLKFYLGWQVWELWILCRLLQLKPIFSDIFDQSCGLKNYLLPFFHLPHFDWTIIKFALGLIVYCKKNKTCSFGIFCIWNIQWALATLF